MERMRRSKKEGEKDKDEDDEDDTDTDDTDDIYNLTIWTALIKIIRSGYYLESLGAFPKCPRI